MHSKDFATPPEDSRIPLEITLEDGRIFDFTPFPIARGAMYKFVGMGGATAILQNRTLKFTSPDDFNDPFDCNISHLTFSRTKDSIKELRKALELTSLSQSEKLKKIRESANPENFKKMYEYVLSKRLALSKVTCFSKKYTDMLMWSHYADNHKGVCLEFYGGVGTSDIISGIGIIAIQDVSYGKTGKINYNKNKEAALVELYTRKSVEWAYEEEVRIVILDSDKQYYDFRSNALTGITFGCRTPKDDVERILNLVKDKKYNVRIQHAVRGEYGLSFKSVTI